MEKVGQYLNIPLRAVFGNHRMPACSAWQHLSPVECVELLQLIILVWLLPSVSSHILSTLPTNTKHSSDANQSFFYSENACQTSAQINMTNWEDLIPSFELMDQVTYIFHLPVMFSRERCLEDTL